MTERDPNDQVTSLNAGGPEELGEQELEEAAGGACGTFSCTLYNIFGNTPELPAET
ncbi:MAG TPA: hypothetical protein VFR81_23490 [Longimicrobium sp.]|nr:hypothetical protein [Longimicrobium sp.]